MMMVVADNIDQFNKKLCLITCYKDCLKQYQCHSYRTERTVIGCSGFHGDCLTLTKILEARLKVDYYCACLAMKMIKH